MSLFSSKKMRDDPQVGMREFLERVIDERDRLYDARFRASEIAVTVALQVQKEATSAAFAVSREAIMKAEVSQTAYNARSNEFRAALADQAKEFIPRIEALALVKSLDEKLATHMLSADSKLEMMRTNQEKVYESYSKEIAAQRAYTATLITQETHTQLLTRIGTLEQANANIQGRIWAIGVGLTIVTTLISIGLHFIK